MRVFLKIAIYSSMASVASAQVRIYDPQRTVERQVENRANNRIDRGINRGLDKVEEGIGNLFKKKKAKPENQPSDTNSQSSDENNVNESKSSGSKQPTTPTFKAYSKFDFVPGEKVTAVEDFMQDEVGDFPAKWNTNGSGEIVTIEGEAGRWLQINDAARVYPEFINNLPENFTLEFKLAANPDPSFAYQLHYLHLAFTPNPEPKEIFGINSTFNSASNVAVAMCPHNKGYTTMRVYDETRSALISNETDLPQFTLKTKPVVKISIWRQKTRLRVYFDEAKVWDIPRAFDPKATYKKLYFASESFGKGPYYISGLRLAVGAPDTRNKLITEGKFVTTGILFDSNSDKIKPESYGTLKQIATVLQENPDVSVKIVGHTDSDGDDAKNLELSKRRAASVKANLSTEFGIDEARFQTDGKGESQPVSPNTSPEGKANNRRVEFIKI